MNFITPQWPSPTFIHALVSTRLGGISKPPFDSLNLGDHVGDQIEDVLANRAVFAKALPAEPLWLQQTHSIEVSTPQSRSLSHGELIRADACVSNIPGEVLVVMTADCLPVLFCNKQGTVVGVAHAGWRGLCAGVLENTIAEMLNISSETSAADLLAWLGPAIGPDSFEVGEDVVNAFRESGLPYDFNAFKSIPHQAGKFMADLYQLARVRIEACGVKSVYGGEYCTVRDQHEFFSYRRDGETGRFASAIWISN